MDISIDSQKRPRLENLIGSLPDECITTIFSFLRYSRDRCSCALVSKKWLHLLANMRVIPSNENSQPRPFSRRLMGKKANDIRLAALAARAYPNHTLTYLCIMGVPPSSITDFGLEIIGKASPFLKSLYLWDCVLIGDSGLASVAKWCKDLERLSIINMPMASDDGLTSVANGCLNLSALSIESCSLIGNGSLEVIASKSLKLEAVSVAKCPLLRDSGIVSVVKKIPKLARLKIASMKIGDEVLEAIRDRGRDLKVLHLEKIKGPSEMGYVLIGAMQKLKLLTMRICVGLTGEMFTGNFSALKEIEVQRCRSIPDKVLMELSKSAKLMISVRLEECSGFTSKGIMEALKNWRKTLKMLFFSKCSIIQSQETNKPGEGGGVPPIKNYPSLTILELKQCNGVGDDLLSSMGPACNKVNDISLAGMNSFTDQGLLRLLNYLNVPRDLTNLDLSGCTTISNQALCTIVQVLGAGLKSLKLDSCSGVNDSVVAEIAKNCTALEELNVSSCGITNISLWWLFYKGKDRLDKLQSLSIAGCTRITNKGLKCMEQMMWDNMKLLDIRNCPGISACGIDSFESMIWWCNVVY